MNERSIFLDALDREDPAQRSAFLDTACAGDATLRRRVEALLRSHDEAGGFLAKPAPELLAEELAARPTNGETQGETPVGAEECDNLDFLTPADKEDLLGRLGHYDIQEVIGRGGMGIVLRAFDEELHRVVAIKVMAAQLATNASARKRFRREAQAAAAVCHDHVVALHAVEEANGLPYLVMQYVSGVSLQERLDRGGALELHEILRVGMQTASGLAAAHTQGLIHRDVKPANILLENGVERVKITDFGLARAADDASLTQSGVVAGTPQYMSPEQAHGEAIDQRADLFSLGSVLYAMCTGRAPFWASGSMAVLKRVCEETPTPIRETNPEIPDWLVAIIDKLHAKDPAQRFQSAAEVAELLGRYLAHVQHPSVAPLPIGVARPESSKGVGDSTPFEDSGRATRRRRWAVAAAAILLCAAGGLGLTETTGVTNFRATVLRICTPDGTLVVETDDPAVKITVEDDGGLVVTGAGPQEVRLRPGSYRLRASKDDEFIRDELVTITHGDKQVVRVRREADAGTPKGRDPQVERNMLLLDLQQAELSLRDAKADLDRTQKLRGYKCISEEEYQTKRRKFEHARIEAERARIRWVATQGAFVLLGGKGVPERKFETLAEAVQGASDGDIIEVRGNGPFVTNPVEIQNRALVIRAGAGFRPVIKCHPDEPGRNLIRSVGPLVLEGLDLQWVNATPAKPESGLNCLVVSWGPRARLLAANCRFLINRSDSMDSTSVCVASWGDTPLFQLRNCQCLIAGDSGQFHGIALQLGGAHNGRMSVDNCLIHGPALQVNLVHAKPRKVILRNNTIVRVLSMRIFLSNKIDSSLGEPASPPIEIETSGNILASAAMQLHQSAQFLKMEKALNASESEQLLKKLIAWRGTENLFLTQPEYLVRVMADSMKTPTDLPVKTLDDWKHFWGTGEAGSQLGQAKFQGGDLVARATSSPELLTPEDYRLRADSPGYRAGKDGKDLGADVDLVGPGPAYERWKKTPDYQQWLKETGQRKK